MHPVARRIGEGWEEWIRVGNEARSAKQFTGIQDGDGLLGGLALAGVF